MAETDKDEGAGGLDAEMGAAEGGGKLNTKKIILIVIPILILGGGAAAAYFLGYIGPKQKVECSTVKPGDEGYAKCAEELAAQAQGQLPGTFIEIPGMIVNLNSLSKQPRFLKISMKVELAKAEDQPKFEAIMPRVVDQFQAYLRELRVEDLKGSSGMYRMKIELLNRVRAAAPALDVKDVLFQEILIQ